MERALSEFVVGGVPTTIPFHLAALEHEKFRSARFDTGFADNDIATERVRFHAEALARRWAVRFDAERAAVGARDARRPEPTLPGPKPSGPGLRGSAGRREQGRRRRRLRRRHLADRETARRVAAIAAAVAAATDRPHRSCPFPPPRRPARRATGASRARLEQMQKRQLAIYPRRDRRT